MGTVSTSPVLLALQRQHSSSTPLNTVSTSPVLLALQRQHSSGTISRLIGHARWSMLKDRIAVMAELRTARNTFRNLCNRINDTNVENSNSSMTFEAHEQVEKAAQQGIKFGVRSKSWAHFVPGRSHSVRHEVPQEA